MIPDDIIEGYATSVGGGAVTSLAGMAGEGGLITIGNSESLPPGRDESWLFGPGTRSGVASWWDPAGGEWNWQWEDSWHPDAHWNYDPWTHAYSPWQNTFPPFSFREAKLQDMESSDTITVIDCYRRGDGGPVIRIDAQRQDFLVQLARVFRRLSSGEAKEIHVLPSDNVLFTKRVRGLTLRRRLEQGVGRSVTVKEAGEQQIEISWENSAAEWEQKAVLLQGVIECQTPCHQYFNDPVRDGLEVEIAFREWRPEVDELL